MNVIFKYFQKLTQLKNSAVVNFTNELGSSLPLPGGQTTWNYPCLSGTKVTHRLFAVFGSESGFITQPKTVIHSKYKEVLSSSTEA